MSGDCSVLHKVKAHAGVGGRLLRTVGADELFSRKYSNHSCIYVPANYAWPLGVVGCGGGLLLYVLIVILLPAILAFVHAAIF